MKKIFLIFLLIAMPVSADTNISEAISSDTRWTPAGGVYVIDSSFSILDGATLTIDPGTIIKAKVTSFGGPSIYGRLVANGTLEEPIYFTAFMDDSVGGDTNQDGLNAEVTGIWQGLSFKPNSTGELNHVIVRFSEAVGIENDEGVLNIKNAYIHDNYQIYFGLISGIGILNKGDLSVSDSVIENHTYGVNSSGSGTVVISGTQILNNIQMGLYVDSQGSLTLLNNHFSGNGRTAQISASTDFTHQGNASNDFSNKGFDIVGTVKDQTVWHSRDLPILITQGHVTVPAGSLLTIESGTLLKFGDHRGVGGLVVNGTLLARGTNDEKIYFTSTKDDTVGGDTNGDDDLTTPATKNWNAIFLESGSEAIFDNVVIRYSGFNFNGEYLSIPAAIYSRGANLIFKNSFIGHNFGASLYQDAGVTDISRSELANSDYGILSRGGTIAISGSKLYGHTDLAIDNRSLRLIDARNNWWGHETGPQDLSISTPTGIGDKVTAHVLYEPWLTSPPAEESEVSDCCSSVIFLPGIKGSVLGISATSGTDILWPPTILSNDIEELALDDNGESIKNVYVNGILNTFYGTEIYAPFTEFMDELVADGTMNEWLPFPYDWRFSPEKILEDGVKRSNSVLNLVEEIEKLAAESYTKQVTIVTHSMGGLLGKALIKELERMRKEHLVDSLVMIGAPQLGIPQALAAILHGDDEGIAAGLIVNSIKVREIAQNMPSLYNLLPSPRYFDEISESVIRFNKQSTFTKEWRNFWGDEGIDAYADYFLFATGKGVMRNKPLPTNLRVPTVLQTDFMNNAANFHNQYDNYKLPNHIRVVQVVGWGRPTTKAIEYKEKHNQPSYEKLFTIEGDGSVVYSSAVSSSQVEDYYFDLASYNALEDTPDYQHRDLLSATPIQGILRLLIAKEDVSETSFIKVIKPEPENVTEQLIISAHSPVMLGVYDEFDNFTGIDHTPNMSTGILSISENIPGSSFIYSAESQYIFLPKEGLYRFVYKGTDDGPTTIEIQSFIVDATTDLASYSDIPTTANTYATFTLNGNSPEETIIEVDINGDGEIDSRIVPDISNFSLNELVTFLRPRIEMSDIDMSWKTKLVRAIVNLETRIKEKKEKNAEIVTMLERRISNGEVKNMIETFDADEVLEYLSMFEMRAENTVFLNRELTDLKTKILSLNIRVNVKSSLLKRVEKLEMRQELVEILWDFAKETFDREGNGSVSSNDVRVMINLLDRLKSAL